MRNAAVVEMLDDDDNDTSFAAAVAARESLLQELAVSGGETSSDKFQAALQILQQHQQQQQQQQSSRNTTSHAGLWLTLTKPTFFDCLGDNDQGDPLYTLGRMSFGLGAPGNLVCSLQGNFNRIERVIDNNHNNNVDATMPVPKSLREEIVVGTAALETYK